ncbi:hypothetical protein ABKV19_026311 [Rosa sericea]
MGVPQDSLADPPKSSKSQRFRNGKQVHHMDIDKELLAAPIKSAKDKFALIPEFLKVRGLVKQHLDSFNYFVNTGIKKIVRANDRIVSGVDPSIWLRFNNIYIDKPSLTTDGVTTEIAPHTCRLSDMTYSAPIRVDVEYVEVSHDQKRIVTRLSKLQECLLCYGVAAVPYMEKRNPNLQFLFGIDFEAAFGAASAFELMGWCLVKFSRSCFWAKWLLPKADTEKPQIIAFGAASVRNTEQQLSATFASEIPKRARMAGQPGGAPSTYSPSSTTRKAKSLIFRNDDVDWVRTDGREFHQCRLACDLPVVISCASLALADAGIMMYDLVASVSVIVIATMALHNYIRRYAQRDLDFDESGNYSSEETTEEMEDNEHEGDGPGRQ